jgi:hypothetical protein
MDWLCEGVPVPLTHSRIIVFCHSWCGVRSAVWTTSLTAACGNWCVRLNTRTRVSTDPKPVAFRTEFLVCFEKVITTFCRRLANERNRLKCTLLHNLLFVNYDKFENAYSVTCHRVLRDKTPVAVKETSATCFLSETHSHIHPHISGYSVVV